MLTYNNVRVHTVGELVEMDFGTVKFEMDYELALQLSQLLRLHGRDAKRKATVFHRIISAMGVLGDKTSRRETLDELTIDMKSMINKL